MKTGIATESANFARGSAEKARALEQEARARFARLLSSYSVRVEPLRSQHTAVVVFDREKHLKSFLRAFSRKQGLFAFISDKFHKKKNSLMMKEYICEII